MFQPQSEIQEINSGLLEIRAEIGKVIIGQHEMIDLLLIGILCNGHILIEGVPGVAKTLAAKLLAKVVDVNFSRIQFTPDLMPSDVLGTSVFDPKSGSFAFKPGPIFSNIVLIDEINRAPAKTQSALFEVMEEKQITIDGHLYLMEEPFVILATQNPIEHEGTYRLPEAQLDRFLFKLEVHYPSLEEEILILESQSGLEQADLLKRVQPLISATRLKYFRDIISNVKVESKLIAFIAGLIHETRNNSSLYLGASTRASIALLKASKANAVINDRDFVIPEDIISMAPHVLRHRVILSPEKEMEGISANELIDNIIKGMEIPR